VARIGIFGGTFDPPHLGHLVLAESALDQLALDQVLWVVAGQSPLKLDRPASPVALRLGLVAAAIAGQPRFALSRADVDRPPPHYSVDTVAIIGRENPEAELFFIMGEDSLRDLPRWRRPQDLIARCRLAVFQRPGIDTDLTQLEAAIPGLSARVDWVSAPEIEIASSDIRQRVQAGHSIRYLVPGPVRELIEQHRLYLPAPASPA
jgi:nicotinate-nucleotide adenylyltransferase